MKHIDDMTVKEFRALPVKPWGNEVDGLDSIVLMPCTLSEGLHDSGFRYIEYALVRDGVPILRTGASSDVLHINGIAGFGKNWTEKFDGVPLLVPPVSWSIDCLHRSGLLRLFCGRKLSFGISLSSQEVWAEDNDSGEVA